MEFTSMTVLVLNHNYTNLVIKGIGWMATWQNNFFQVHIARLHMLYHKMEEFSYSYSNITIPIF